MDDSLGIYLLMCDEWEQCIVVSAYQPHNFADIETINAVMKRKLIGNCNRHYYR